MFPNNMEVSSLVINITTKGPDLKSSLRVSSQISSKHTYLLVPSGNLPLNNRANFYFEVKIPDWCYNLYPQFNCKIAPKRLQLFPLLKLGFRRNAINKLSNLATCNLKGILTDFE